MHAAHTHAQKVVHNLPTPALAGRRLKCIYGNVGLIVLLSQLRILRPKVFKALPWQQVLSDSLPNLPVCRSCLG